MNISAKTSYFEISLYPAPLMYLLKRLDDTSNIKAIYENDNIKNMRRSYYNSELDFLKQYRHGGLRSWKHV